MHYASNMRVKAIGDIQAVTSFLNILDDNTFDREGVKTTKKISNPLFTYRPKNEDKGTDIQNPRQFMASLRSYSTFS